MEMTRKTVWLIGVAAIAAGLAAGTAAGWYFGSRSRAGETPVSFPATVPESVPAPDAATLKRAADRALREIGVRARSAGVELDEPLSDGSRLVTVHLENGRTAQGRLYRDRLRWKISLDRRSLWDADRVIVVEHERHIR